MRMTKEQRMATRYIPENSTRLDAPEADAVVYLYEFAGALYAIGYSGTRSRADFHYRYRSEGHRLDHINNWRSGLAAYKRAREKEKAGRKRGHDLPVGTIFCFSWGYEQTNLNFYQVVSTTKCTVTIREIAQKVIERLMPMAEMRVPIPDQFVGPEIKNKRVRDSKYITMASYGSCSVWDGKPKYCSWYH